MGRHQGHCAIRNSQFDKEMPDEHTLGSVLQKAGYATAAIGKWGLQGGKYQLKWPGQRGDRSPELEPSHPLLRGFDFCLVSRICGLELARAAFLAGDRGDFDRLV